MNQLPIRATNPRHTRLRLASALAFASWWGLGACVVALPILCFAVGAQLGWPLPVGMLLLVAILFILARLASKGVKCIACGAPVLRRVPGGKLHPHARKFLGASHRLQVAWECLTRDTFHCMHCYSTCKSKRRLHAEGSPLIKAHPGVLTTPAVQAPAEVPPVSFPVMSPPVCKPADPIIPPPTAPGEGPQAPPQETAQNRRPWAHHGGLDLPGVAQVSERPNISMPDIPSHQNPTTNNPPPAMFFPPRTNISPSAPEANATPSEQRPLSSPFSRTAPIPSAPQVPAPSQPPVADEAIWNGVALTAETPTVSKQIHSAEIDDRFLKAGDSLLDDLAPDEPAEKKPGEQPKEIMTHQQTVHQAQGEQQVAVEISDIVQVVEDVRTALEEVLQGMINRLKNLAVEVTNFAPASPARVDEKPVEPAVTTSPVEAAPFNGSQEAPALPPNPLRSAPTIVRNGHTPRPAADSDRIAELNNVLAKAFAVQQQSTAPAAPQPSQPEEKVLPFVRKNAEPSIFDDLPLPPLPMVNKQPEPTAPAVVSAPPASPSTILHGFAATSVPNFPTSVIPTGGIQAKMQAAVVPQAPAAESPGLEAVQTPEPAPVAVPQSPFSLLTSPEPVAAVEPTPSPFEMATPPSAPSETVASPFAIAHPAPASVASPFAVATPPTAAALSPFQIAKNGAAVSLPPAPSPFQVAAAAPATQPFPSPFPAAAISTPLASGHAESAGIPFVPTEVPQGLPLPDQQTAEPLSASPFSVVAKPTPAPWTPEDAESVPVPAADEPKKIAPTRVPPFSFLLPNENGPADAPEGFNPFSPAPSNGQLSPQSPWPKPPFQQGQ